MKTVLLLNPRNKHSMEEVEEVHADIVDDPEIIGELEAFGLLLAKHKKTVEGIELYFDDFSLQIKLKGSTKWLK